MSTNAEKFWTIVLEEMAKQDIHSIRALERIGNVGNSTISERMKDLLPPTPTIMYAISKGLQVPMETVEKWAKGRRPEPNVAMERRMVYMFQQLPPEKQRDILTQVRALVEDSQDLETEPT